MAAVSYPFRNMRGVCYLPTYNTLNTSPPFTGWTGVSGFDRFWQYYSASLAAGSTGEEVYNQLERIKKAGFNTIRVWMAFNPSKSPYNNYAYVGDEASYAAKYAHFIAVAAAHGLRVIPVIFDSYTASPSEAYMTSCNGSSYQDWKSSAAKTFIDVMTTGELQYPGTILMWDLFNEPWYGDWADSTVVKTFLLYAARYLKEQKFLDYFTVPNLVSANGWKGETDQIETANSDYVDVLSVHPYALTKHYLATQLKTLRNDVCADKPVVITETGAPGYGYNYVEALDYVAKYRLGYVLYQAMIGWADATSQFLHLYESGIFYYNGKVRETEVVKRVRSDARADGVAVGDLYSEAEIDA
ncbi:cellulase family glycosylhydrolase, partial [bacterium]|nr:cellulase family glycosylhydrolase [bacterium]